MRMDRSEPSLVPEWLKSGGSLSGGGSRQQQSSSSLRSDDRPANKNVRNRSSLGSGIQVSDRTTSSFFRRSSSSKGSTHSRSYSSSKTQRDEAWEDFYQFHHNDKPFSGLQKNRDYSDPLGSLLPGKFDKDVLRRSQSMNGRRQEETWRSQVVGDISNARNGGHNITSGLLTKGRDGSSTTEAALGQDFPCLGTEERQRVSEVARIPSPGTATTFQRPSSANSDKTSADGWTALAEVPGVVGNNNASGLLSQQTVSGSSAILGQTMNGLRMAEAVAQSPSRARTPPQLSVDSQRLEELAIKQSRQLIPMTPSMPKSQLLSSMEKSKTRAAQQTTKFSPSLYGNQPMRGGSARVDVGKTSNLGKLQVLKPSGELNGVSLTVKENLVSPNGIKVPLSPLNLAPSTVGSHSKNSVGNPNLGGSERKPAASLTTLEKRPSLQTQSRNDFFNLIKKKSSASFNSSTDTTSTVSVSDQEKSEPLSTEAGADTISVEAKHQCASVISVSDFPTENGREIVENGDACECALGFIRNGEERLDYPNEEEAAFLRSLGWEEGAADGDDEGLTEEEISAFYEEYLKSRPSSQHLGDEQKFLHLNMNGNGSFGLSSAGSRVQS
ncbi:uncharacterized protein LOC115727567 [Rhodamnia argentea]|uniref:Uncharacterized protein LOC115727567 n=1 Tax=Rhodamnia argentea TaxID=178133 RepID=A0A8B8MUD3_9MYRT|nr:uncharacterized protein LOC115727567 [Rhodamnia argentea]XP_048135564.1 uncharacterized protein LOC115727567 [Rhodamnia argentea]XP_048135565.1 uncharacterized protein LOC115727567 [Rhodamnia argentea]